MYGVTLVYILLISLTKFVIVKKYDLDPSTLHLATYIQGSVGLLV